MRLTTKTAAAETAARNFVASVFRDVGLPDAGVPRSNMLDAAEVQQRSAQCSVAGERRKEMLNAE